MAGQWAMRAEGSEGPINNVTVATLRNGGRQFNQPLTKLSAADNTALRTGFRRKMSTDATARIHQTTLACHACGCERGPLNGEA
jgi:hypothetical protein